MPEFHERDAQHQEWKNAVLAGEIELEEIDTAQYTMRTNQTPQGVAKKKQAAAG